MIDDEMLRCLRWDREGDERLRSLNPDGWLILWTFVEAGAAGPLLTRRVKMSGVAPPKSIADRMRSNVLAVAARNLSMRAALADAINATGKPALLLKGVDLAERVYGNLGHRPMGDVDFLVRGEDASAYHAFLSSRGFSVSPAFDERLLQSTAAHHFSYTRKDGAVLELHWRLADGDDGGLSSRVWRDAVGHPQFASHAYVMSPEQLFLHLCLHQKHHLFETSLIQFWDIAELIRHPSLAIDWAAIRVLAQERRLERSMDLLFYMLREHLGVLPPPAIGNPVPFAIGIQPIASPLARLGVISYGEHQFHLLAQAIAPRSSWAERLEAILGSLLPSRNDVRARHGSPNDGPWRDSISYLRRWAYLVRTKLPIIGRYLSRRSAGATEFDRVVALRRYLDPL